MKKFGQIVLVFLLSVGMFTGCGTSYKADESTVFVLKDGKIVSTDVENFDEKTYDKDGLKEYVKNEIDTYNEKNGKGSVSLKKLDTGEKKATLTIAYRTAEDYQKFNDMELYTGSVAEALAAGYSFDGSFASVKNGKIKACESSAFLDDSSCKVVVIRGNTNVKVKGTIITDGSFYKCKSKRNHLLCIHDKYQLCGCTDHCNQRRNVPSCSGKNNRGNGKCHRGSRHTD